MRHVIVALSLTALIRHACADARLGSLTRSATTRHLQTPSRVCTSRPAGVNVPLGLDTYEALLRSHGCACHFWSYAHPKRSSSQRQQQQQPNSSKSPVIGWRAPLYALTSTWQA